MKKPAFLDSYLDTMSLIGQLGLQLNLGFYDTENHRVIFCYDLSQINDNNSDLRLYIRTNQNIHIEMRCGFKSKIIDNNGMLEPSSGYLRIEPNGSTCEFVPMEIINDFFNIYSQSECKIDDLVEWVVSCFKILEFSYKKTDEQEYESLKTYDGLINSFQQAQNQTERMFEAMQEQQKRKNNFNN